MARLLRPVTKIISDMPAEIASSTACWMSGLSTIGIISLGLALVAGRKRVPRPATGNTALVIRFIALRGSETTGAGGRTRAPAAHRPAFQGKGEYGCGSSVPR